MDHVYELEKINRVAYANADVIEHYARIERLLPAERVIFAFLEPELKDSRLLDIGIGGGRTTSCLADAVGSYTGIDYLPEFVSQTRSRYPNCKILCADATDMKVFGNEEFDLVFFSYNGLDSLPHELRLKALKEMHRVLRPGGRLIFSSHNRDYIYFRKLPWRRRIEPTLAFVRFFLYSLYHLPKHWKMRRYEVIESDYAIVNDSDHRYGLLFYYITAEKQREQLRNAGFSEVSVYNADGERARSMPEIHSHYHYYFARK